MRDPISSNLVPPARADELRAAAISLAAWDLTFRQVHDLELLATGAFHPLSGYLGRDDYEAVLRAARLADGRPWPIPIVLDVSEAFADALAPGQRVALRHPEGIVLAVVTVSEVWAPDRAAEARAVFGTDDEEHPGVRALLHETNPRYVGGDVEGVELPPHHTFRHLRHSPDELRREFDRRGWSTVVGFQTRNPMHRAHVELTRRAAEGIGGGLLLHPVVGRTSPGDVDYFTRVRCYEAALAHYPEDSAALSLLPLAMRMGGPREALWHAIIRRNYGCTHFIVGRDHAGPRRRSGEPFYGPYDAQHYVRSFADDVGIEVVSFEEVVYSEADDEYRPRSEVSDPERILSLSGTEFRRFLERGDDIPAWFSYPEIVDQLRRRYPDRRRQGFTVFFTGLSGAGKSTVANVLVAKLMERGDRPVTLLDGDIVRKHLSSELGFSKAHRDLNIQRIGFVASEITKNRGVAVCAPIAPYAEQRRNVREQIEPLGGFVEVFVSTPLDVCEQRDRKGLYAKARAGLITGFTGIDDPYEVPERPDVVIDTADTTSEAAAQGIIDHLVREGFLSPAT